MRDAACHASGGGAPLVSVSMLTYNHEAYVKRAIDSVMAQETSFPFELVIGEDCSTDQTRSIVQECAHAYGTSVRLILPDRNLGGGGVPLLARTLRACRGGFIARLDGDDYWTSTSKLEQQVAYLRTHTDRTMCFHNVLRVVEGDVTAPTPYNPPTQPDVLELDDLFDHCVLGSCSPLIRREAIWPIPDWFDALPLGDWPLYMLAARTGRIGYMSELMGVYRVHRGGVWSGVGELDQARVMVDFLEQIVSRLGLTQQARARAALAYRRHRLAKLLANAGDLTCSAPAGMAGAQGRRAPPTPRGAGADTPARSIFSIALDVAGALMRKGSAKPRRGISGLRRSRRVVGQQE